MPTKEFTKTGERKRAIEGLNAFVSEWKRVKNTDSLKDLQAKLHNAGSSIDLDKILQTVESKKNRYADRKFYDEVCSVFNRAFADSIGRIEDDWTFISATVPILQYYALYYPKNELIIRALVVVSVLRGRWVDFKMTGYRNIGENSVPGSSYQAQESDIHPNPHLTYVFLKSSTSQNPLSPYFHAYTFNIQPENLIVQRYIFGTFSRIRKNTFQPTAGVCLLSRCYAESEEEALKEIARPVSHVIENALYNRRVELHHEECDQNLQSLPNQKLVEGLQEFVATYQGNHNDSDLRGGEGFLRSFIVDITGSGKATIEFSDSEDCNPKFTVNGFFTLLQGRLLYGEFAWDSENSISRLIISLERGPDDTLLGCYGGYSLKNAKPYAGAVVLRKIAKPMIWNISRKKQNLKEHGHLLEHLKYAHDKYLNLPDQCLNNEMLSSFLIEETDELSNLDSYFRSFSISSQQDAIVEYPFQFRKGICYLKCSSGKVEHITAPIRRIKQDYIWLEFTGAEKSIFSFYCGPGKISAENYFAGISFRISSKGKLQAKKEIIIRSLGDSPYKSYKLGSQELQTLIEDRVKKKIVASLLGREYSLMHVAKVNDLKAITKRREFRDIFLVYAIKCYAEDKTKNEWVESLQQAVLHGGILQGHKFINSIAKIVATLGLADKIDLNDFNHMYQVIAKDPTGLILLD